MPGVPLTVARQPDQVAVLSMDHGQENVFDTAMWSAWDAALGELAARPPRALLVRAEGPVVSTGVDVEVFASLSPVEAVAFWRDKLRLTQRLEQLPCPTVFAAHSLTLTAAFELALACDFIVATPSARFGLVERVVGFTPAMGGTQRLALRIGRNRAAQMIMQGSLVRAPLLHEWGLVAELLDQSGFAASALDFASALAAGPTQAFAATKDVLNALAAGGLTAADEAVGSAVRRACSAGDHRRAVDAFLTHGPRHHTSFEGR